MVNKMVVWKCGTGDRVGTHDPTTVILIEGTCERGSVVVGSDHKMRYYIIHTDD